MLDSEQWVAELDERVAAERAASPDAGDWEIARDVMCGVLNDLADAFAARAARDTATGGETDGPA